MRCASSCVTQLATASGAVRSGFSGSWYCSPLHDPVTTFQGYDALSVVCTRMTPAAPCRSASSSLYVQRP